MSPRQLQIQPLSRAAWQRVEHQVFTSLDRHERSGEFPAVRPRAPRRPAGAFLAGLALVASVSLLWLALERGRGVDAASTPGALATSAGAEAGEAGEARLGSRVATTAPVDVPIGDSVVTLGAQSVVQVQGDDERGWLLELHRGEVACRVAPRAGRGPFVVRAGDTTVTVVGTRFSVSRAEEGARVLVHEGVVRVERAGKVVQMLAGDSWPPEAAQPPAEAVDGSEPGAPGEAKQVESVSAERPRRSASAGRKARRAPSGPQQAYERAVRLEASDPDAALEMYGHVGGRGAWAANALYGRARLRLERGDAPGARRDLELYLRRHPQGSNVADVRALLEREPPL